MAIPADIEVALRLSEAALAETLAGLESKVRRFWKALESTAEDFKGYRELMDVYKDEFAEVVSRTTLRDKYIEPLKDAGLLEVLERKGSKGYVFSVQEEELASSVNFEKLRESAFDAELEDTSFVDLLATGEGVYGTLDKHEVKIKNKHVLDVDLNPKPTAEDLKKLCIWSHRPPWSPTIWRF